MPSNQHIMLDVILPFDLIILRWSEKTKCANLMDLGMENLFWKDHFVFSMWSLNSQLTGMMVRQHRFADHCLLSPIHTCVDFSRSDKFKTSWNSNFSAVRCTNTNQTEFESNSSKNIKCLHTCEKFVRKFCLCKKNPRKCELGFNESEVD